MIWDWLAPLFGAEERNPTADWQADSRRAVEIDLDRHEIRGVGIGDAWERLKFLGPGRFNGSFLSFPHLGLSFDLDNDQIESCDLHFSLEESEEWKSFSGEFLHGGRRAEITPATTQDEFVSLFGEPWWRDDEGGESLLFYEFPGREWQVEFDEDGLLCYWEIGRPELADPVVRESYNIHKPWPPR